MTGKNDQKLNDKVPPVKRRKWWFFRTPAGALDSLNFCLFWIKNLENQDFLPWRFLSNIIKFYTTCFPENHRFLKNISGFPEIVHFLKNGHFLKNSSFFKKPRVFRKRVSCPSSKMTGKNGQKSNDKIPPVKRRKRWFYRTPAGAFDILNFCLFWIKNLENQDFLSQILLIKDYKILHDVFSGKSPIFRKCLGFSRNRPFFKKLVIF